jgi:hypothetical protein
LPFLQLFKPRYDDQNKLLPIGFTDVKKFLQDNLFQEFEPVFLNELDIDPAELSDFLVENKSIFQFKIQNFNKSISL